MKNFIAERSALSFCVYVFLNEEKKNEVHFRPTTAFQNPLAAWFTSNQNGTTLMQLITSHVLRISKY